jgi:hypothetical protein
LQMTDKRLEAVEQVRMGVVLFKQPRDELGTVEAKIDAAQVLSQAQIAFQQMPFG